MKQIITIITLIFVLITNVNAYENITFSKEVQELWYNNDALAEKIDAIVVKLVQTEKWRKKLEKVLERIDVLANKMASWEIKTISNKNAFILYTLTDSILIRTAEKQEELKNTYEDSGEPINLLNNQKYHIRIEWEGWEVTDWEIPIFDIKKNKDEFEITKYYKDLDTWNIKESYDSDEYNWYFELTERWNYDKVKSEVIWEVLNIKRCYYYYKYIQEWLRCNEFQIPIIVNSENIQGYYRYFSVDSDYNNYDDYSYKVTVLWKNKEELECNIRGSIKDDTKIYYTQNHPEYNKLRKFTCFESINQAVDNGYSLNYYEENNK